MTLSLTLLKSLTCALPSQAILVRVPLTVLQYSILSSIITGIGGSLSTVSTWVVEVGGTGGRFEADR